MASSSQAIYDQDGTQATQLGISGSPTFVINGAQVNVDRTPESIKEAVCASFTTEPSVCSQNLSTVSSSTGFGADSGGATSGTQCG